MTETISVNLGLTALSVLLGAIAILSIRRARSYLKRHRAMALEYRRLECELQRTIRIYGEEHHGLVCAISLMFDDLSVRFDVQPAEGPVHQASLDLKTLAAFLRDDAFYTNRTDEAHRSIQQTLWELGDRYGIEPENGGPYCISRLVRIGHEAMITGCQCQNIAAVPQISRNADAA